MGTSLLCRGAVAGLLAAAVGAVGCGGSGGTGTSPAPAPGVLSTLAAEGGPTPAGGTYGAFGPTTPLCAADGGWVAFVADVADGPTPRGLFVATPDGPVALVYAAGETVPGTNGATGTVDGFERIWMRPGGVVVALVGIAGGSDEGVVTARVDVAGTVTSKATAVHRGRPMPAGSSGVAPGTLTDVDDDHVEVTDAGNVCFVGTTSHVPTYRGVWAVRRDGSHLEAVAVTDDPVNDGAAGTFGTLGLGFSGLGLDEDGELVAFACDVEGGPDEVLFVTRGTGLAVVARDGNAPPSMAWRLFDDVYEDGPIVVRLDGTGTGSVTWRGSLDGAAPDAGIFTRRVTVLFTGFLLLGALNDVVLPTETVPGTNGGIAADCRLLTGQDDPSLWPIEVVVSGGNADRVFLGVPDPATLTEILRQGSPAPGTQNSFADTYPSLTLDRYDAQSRDGSLAFTAVLVDLSTGLWWPVPGSSFSLVAAEGAPAPGTGGGAFGSFATPSAVSAAHRFLAFRAAVVGGTAASALFRQS